MLNLLNHFTNMKLISQKRFAFAGKSLLWSLLLYVIMMLAFNWDDISNSVTGRNTITVVNHMLPESSQAQALPALPGAAAISERNKLVDGLIKVIRVITGSTSRR
jgi:hypothetical protein